MIWVRRVVPMLLGAGILYLGWRLVSANGAAVDVDLVVARIEAVALWRALASAFALGVVLVGTVLVLQLFRHRLTLRRYRKQLAALEQEVHQLRNLPLGAAAAGDPAEATARRGGEPARN